VRLAQTGNALFPFDKVIERAEEENRGGRVISLRHPASIADFSGCERRIWLLAGRGSRLLHMFRYRIDQMNLISAGSEPARVDP
jgi:hypothetical protein